VQPYLDPASAFPFQSAPWGEPLFSEWLLCSIKGRVAPLFFT